MKDNVEMLTDNLFEGNQIKSNNTLSDNKKITLKFNAGVGVFIVFSLFFMFFMIPVTTLVSYGLEINLLPLAIAIMMSAVVGITLFFLSHAIDVIDVLINK